MISYDYFKILSIYDFYRNVVHNNKFIKLKSEIELKIQKLYSGYGENEIVKVMYQMLKKLF